MFSAIFCRLKRAREREGNVGCATERPLYASNATICLRINPLDAELNSICYLLALLGAHHFLHVCRIRVKHIFLSCGFTSLLIFERKIFRRIYGPKYKDRE
jgi:hypothetical protein